MDAHRELPQLLREIRESRGQSMEQAAVYIGTNRQSYRLWERGEQAPSHIKWVFGIYDWAAEGSTWSEVYDAVVGAYARIMGVDIPGYLNGHVALLSFPPRLTRRRTVAQRPPDERHTAHLPQLAAA